MPTRKPENAPRMPRGKAPRPNAAAIKRAAEITDDDIADAQAQFRRDAPAAYRDLLDAEPRPDTLEPPTPPAT